MLLSIEGQEKTGKTGFAYTAPLPIVGFQFDLGHDRALNGTLWDKYYKDLKINIVKYNRISPQMASNEWAGYDITIYELPQPIQLDSTEIVDYIKLWNYFISLCGDAFSDGGVRSIILDTATVGRGVKANAYVEELNTRNPSSKRKQLLQIEYGHVNSVFENLYTLAKALGKNFITLHHLRDTYVKQNVGGNLIDVPNGQLELDGWNKTYRFVDTAIRQTRENTTLIDGSGKPYQGNAMNSEIIICGDNPDMVGTKLPNMDWNMLTELISGSLGGRVNYDKR